MHLVWCESVRCNLCKHEVFRHFEQGLRHRGIPWYGLWESTTAFCSHNYVMYKTRKIRPFFSGDILSYSFDTISQMYPQKPMLYSMKMA